MVWMIFVAGAVLSWGAYGALLHQGQTQLGNPLKALLCVGVAYFLMGVIVPVAALSAQGGLSGFNTNGLIMATGAGALGAAGAVCIIWAFRSGGLPVYVMPLVFGGAPIVKGTRVPVRAIVTYYLSCGDTVETIAQQLPPLTPAQIHDALSYYYDHQSEIDEERRRNEDESYWRSYLQEHEVAIDASDRTLHAG